MKKNITSLVLLSILIFTTINSNAQSYSMQIGDTLWLKLNTFRGNLQWQESSDSNTWKDILNANYQPYAVKFSTPKCYRGKVTEGSCNAIYTDVTKTILATGITDIDGNLYDTIRIGTQVWFKQNLNTSRLNDGTSIPNITDNGIWAALTTSGRGYYDNDSLMYADTYGALYNWYAVNTNKLCPIDYHVPTDNEWHTMILYIDVNAQGMMGIESYNAGGKLKEIGTTHWTTPNTGATNEYGFTALPSGYRFDSGGFNAIGGNEYWWSSTVISSYNFGRTVDYTFEGVNKTSFPKGYGISVRCVKD